VVVVVLLPTTEDTSKGVWYCSAKNVVEVAIYLNIHLDIDPLTRYQDTYEYLYT
jgi:hypothetical protein